MQLGGHPQIGAHRINQTEQRFAAQFKLRPLRVKHLQAIPLNLIPRIHFGVESRGDARENAKGTAEVDKILRDLEGKIEQNIPKLLPNLLDFGGVGVAQFAQIAPFQPFHQHRLRLDNAFQIAPRQEKAHAVIGVNHSAGIVLDNANQHLTQIRPQIVGNTADHPKINEDDLERPYPPLGQLLLI